MTENFAQLFAESMKNMKIRPGSIIRGVVVSLDKDRVFIDTGLKSESAIPLEQFKNIKGEIEVKIGDEVDVTLDAIEDGFGETQLSREKAKRHETWVFLEKAYEESTNITGIISGKVKGGFTVEINGVRAFLPGSLVDIRPVRDILYLEGKSLEFKLIKLDKKHNNIVVSRRAVIESEYNSERDDLLNNLYEGMTVTGIVKNLTDYGAFIDLGGIDGLLHITDMAWKRVKHPNNIVSIGDKITVKVLKFDRDSVRVSLGLKQLEEDPWISLSKKYPIGTKLTGKVTNITDYGCFVEIADNIEGLVHISEMDWTCKNINPFKITNVGEIIEVMILSIDEERRRISLGLKQCKVNPWAKFAEKHNKGDKIQGIIKSVTEFGIFVGLDNNIDGLVHLSDISWYKSGEEVINQYTKGDNILTVILQIDVERERISLGIKQLMEDPFNEFVKNNNKGDIITGQIISLDSKNIIIKLSDGIEGQLFLSDFSYSSFLKENSKQLRIGDTLETIILGFDRKNRIVNLASKSFEKNDAKASNKKDNSTFSNVMTEAFKAAKGE